MQSSDTDLIYSQPQNQIKNFNFDAQVVEVFPDMISRSVPGYNTIIDTIGRLSQKYVKNDSLVYDLGCSLGAATLAMRRAINADNCKIIGIDNSNAMVERCKMHVQAFKGKADVEIQQADIMEVEFKKASMMVLNFTLQFIERENRQTLLNRIADNMHDGGILVLSEKVTHEDEICRDAIIDLHHDFKRANGYSELEIAQKRSALEDVMKVDTLAQQIERLHNAGFTHVSPWFQCFNFTSLIAIK
jgi:tRNA (cmo5U34)-methyltransferase